MANHLLNVCRSSTSKFEYLQVQLIEKVSVQNDDDIDKVLWEREKYFIENNTFIDLLFSLI